MSRRVRESSVRVVGDGGCHLFITLCERLPDTTPAAGDLRLRVDVHQDGFRGVHSRVWVAAPDWRRFIADLRHLEQTRVGRASVEAMSPDQFRLSFFTFDTAGHIAVEGFIGRDHTRRYGQRVSSRVSFTLEPDTSQFRQLVERFAALAAADDGGRF